MHLETALDGLGSALRLSSGETFRLERPLSAVFLQSPMGFDDARDHLEPFTRGVQPAYAQYSDISRGGPKSVPRILSSLQPMSRGGSLGLWIRVNAPTKLPSNANLVPDAGYIFLCPERIEARARQLKTDLVERPRADLRRALLNVVLRHEMGHHYSLANLSRQSYSWLWNHHDLNFAEGLANWFALALANELERWIIAELATSQDSRYRYYHSLRHVRLAPILEKLMDDDDPKGAVYEFANVVGGKLILDGNRLRVQSDISGLIIDWTGRGGTLLVGGSILMLGPFFGAVVIASRIEHLLGRFPSSTFVLANEIADAPDYGRMPPNIRTIPAAELDLRTVISGLSEDEVETFVRSTVARYSLTNANFVDGR